MLSLTLLRHGAVDERPFVLWGQLDPPVGEPGWAAMQRAVDGLRRLNPTATMLLASSPATLDPGPSIAGLRALVIEDGPTITHGGMPFGAGTVAARAAGARRRAGRAGASASAISRAMHAFLWVMSNVCFAL